jgi:hypothetical protein
MDSRMAHDGILHPEVLRRVTEGPDSLFIYALVL